MATDLDILFEDINEEGLLSEIEELSLDGYEDIIVDAADDVSPGTGTMAPDGGTLTAVYYCRASDLNDAILRILGDTDYQTNSVGGLIRTLPLAHPKYPSYVANKVSWKGMGESRLAWVDDSEFEANSVAAYTEYPLYRLEVSFAQPPYAVLTDEAIDQESFTWYDEEGEEFFEEVSQEWYRYCLLQKAPAKIEVVTAQNGQMYLHDEGGVKRAFNALPSMRLPTTSLVLTWYRVPYRFFIHPDSWIEYAQGKVNQMEFLGYKPGYLYLDNVEATPYCPPIPGYEVSSLGFTRSTEQHCDIRFTFLVRTRDAFVPITPDNANHIAAGHNCYPNFKQKRWLYATTEGTPEEGTPNFKSIPFQLLFKDPDS
jgi:hypothetical protein